ncbi:MAG: GDP-mannose mannosyl hydrolase [Motiliproteus sp.]|nr:GDP-mannose mannosyl hydrolase [Motiliproteus sp.]MCW9050821.1 GDP-mannose mannosyl hydrolase [Motiliproteus sp.]
MDKDVFLNIIDATPLVSIDLILEDSTGCVLLGTRSNRPAQGFWFVPGGRIRKGETLAAAFERISSTELGYALNIADAELLGAYDHMYPDNFHGTEGIETHYVALGYRVRVPEGFQFIGDDQHTAMRWWDKQTLLSANDVHQNTKAYIR